MNGIPAKTNEFLKNVVRTFPKTPYKGAMAIKKFMFYNYSYGCDENIQQEKWIRYPDEIQRFMNCQDAGIFNYLLAKQLGLDVVLVKFDDFDNTSQSHLAALISGNDNYYILSNSNMEKIILKDNYYMSLERKNNEKEEKITTATEEKNFKNNFKNKNDNLFDFNKHKNSLEEKTTFSKISFLDQADVVNIISSSQGREGFLTFFEKGQMLSTYFGKNYGLNRFIKINHNFMELRKTFDFTGYFFNLFFLENEVKYSFSSGVNNSLLINQVDMFCEEVKLEKEKKLCENAKERSELTHLLYSEEIDKKIHDAWIRNKIATFGAEEHINHSKNKNILNILNREYTKKENSTLVTFEGQVVPSKIYSIPQLKMAAKKTLVEKYINSINEDAFDKIKLDFYKDREKDSNLCRKLILNEYVKAQRLEGNQRQYKIQIELLTKAENLAREYGINTFSM